MQDNKSKNSDKIVMLIHGDNKELKFSRGKILTRKAETPKGNKKKRGAGRGR